MMIFDIPKNQSSIIKVIGVGGGGSNAVNHMFNQGIKGVDFIVCNTDLQALEYSPVPTKVQLGTNLTEGRGAGSLPSVGRSAAVEDIEKIREILERNTKMLFITAGMGGGTGTGAAPVIAATAREMDILTVAIVTIPFMFEGRKRRQQAEEGLRELRNNVDTLLIICNDKLRDLYGDLPLSAAFSNADDILTTAAKGIAEIITVAGNINVDFADVKTVMKDSGVAIMGSGIAEGENRALKAVGMALSSPLLNDSNIKGASNMLLYISSGLTEISMDEVSEITDFVQNAAGSTAEIIWGVGRDENLENKINITLVATGFKSSIDLGSEMSLKDHTTTKKITNLGVDEVKPTKEPVKTDLDDMYLKPTDVVENFNETPSTEISMKNTETPSTKITHELFSDDSNTSIINENQTSKQSTADIDDLYFMKNKPEQNPEFVLKASDFKVEQAEERREVLEDEMTEKARQRIVRLRELSLKLKTPNGLNELEKEPAYKRRNVEITDSVPSSETYVSRLSLGDNEEGTQTELRSNNSFLHDNVD